MLENNNGAKYGLVALGVGVGVNVGTGIGIYIKSVYRHILSLYFQKFESA